MVHPLYRSWNGAILWEELPEMMRLFDNPQGDAPGDLRAFLDGFGHLLDRFEATLEQFHADGFSSPDPVEPNAPQMQAWLVPYMADLFGVTLYGPDPESRRNEMAQSIWVARRRGTLLAIDLAAESILGRSLLIVSGLDRVLQAPDLRAPLLTHEEKTGRPHPLDAVLLQEPAPVAGTLSALRRRHAGLPTGSRNVTRRMRAVQTGLPLIETDIKQARDALGAPKTIRFRIEDRAGLPCFPASFEDRAVRRPDIRAPRRARLAPPAVARPDAIYLHVDPPAGVFDGTLQVRRRLPDIRSGEIGGRDTDAQGLFFVPGGAGRLRLRATNASALDGRHRIEGLRMDGTLDIGPGRHVTIENAAIRHIRLAANSQLTLRNSLCHTITADAPGTRIEMEYVTVTGSADLPRVLASDCILSQLTVTGTGLDSCVRFSWLESPLLPAAMPLHRTTNGAIRFLEWPCLPDSSAPAGTVTRRATFGEPGYGVLSDMVPPALASAAEDGSEPGAYHGAYHLARLRAAVLRATDFAPAGYRIFASYDLRSAAPLPTEAAGSDGVTDD